MLDRLLDESSIQHLIRLANFISKTFPQLSKISRGVLQNGPPLAGSYLNIGVEDFNGTLLTKALREGLALVQHRHPGLQHVLEGFNEQRGGLLVHLKKSVHCFQPIQQMGYRDKRSFDT